MLVAMLGSVRTVNPSASAATATTPRTPRRLPNLRLSPGSARLALTIADQGRYVEAEQAGHQVLIGRKWILGDRRLDTLRPDRRLESGFEISWPSSRGPEQDQIEWQIEWQLVLAGACRWLVSAGVGSCFYWSGV